MVQLPVKTEDTATELSTKTASLNVQGMKCAGCVKSVERQLQQNSGVVAASVNLITEVAVVEYQPELVEPETLATKLTSKGFPAQLRVSNSNSYENVLSKQEQENRQQLWRLITAAMLLLFSSLGHLHHLGFTPLPLLSNIWFHWGLATLALAIPGFSILADGARGLWQGMPNMNSLIGLGTFSAYTTSTVALLFPQLGWECFFDEPVMLLGFIFLGRTLEGRARNKAASALTALLALQPKVARLIAPDSKSSKSKETGIQIPVEQVQVGEWVWVLPGEQVPVDGVVVEGSSTIDQSMVTGESIAVLKQLGDKVTAGTMNQSGAIAVRTTQTGDNTTLAQIIASVQEAQMRKAPIQQLADTVAGYFTYGVMTVAGLTLLFWYFVGTKIWPDVLLNIGHDGMAAMSGSNSSLLLSLKLAIAVLVISCPCALGLATPTAILVGTGIGAERGLLIKGGDILERVQQLDTVVFDKTGTLTIGQPEVTDILPLGNGEINVHDLLQLAATAESGTNHPLATAIVNAAKELDISILAATNFATFPGLGVSSEIEGKRIWLGNEDWIGKQGIEIEKEIKDKAKYLVKQGKNLVYVAVENSLVGLIALKDELRPDAAATVKKLQDWGLETVLLTGDCWITGKAIASQVGISQVFAEVKPNEKAAIIQSLQATNKAQASTTKLLPRPLDSGLREREGLTVAMVGDGINDAPALAQADIGISLKMGTEVAVETAGIILMRDRLLDLVQSIQLSKATTKKIRQNLFWALGYNAIAIPIAAGILLPLGVVLNPATAAAFMALSSVTVVANSLLLRRSFSFVKDNDMIEEYNKIPIRNHP